MPSDTSRVTAVHSVKGFQKGALRMAWWLRLFRGLGLAGLLLGGVLFGGAVGSMATADFAVAQSASTIVVEGNRRVEADTIRSYFRLAPGQRLDAAKIDEAYKAL